MMDRRAFYDNFGDIPYTADMAEVLAKWRGQHAENDGAQAGQRRCVRCRGKTTGEDLVPLKETFAASSEASAAHEASGAHEGRSGSGKAARWGAALLAGASLLVATTVYALDSRPADGGVAVVYSGTYGTEDFGAAKQVMVEGFEAANAAAGLPRSGYWLAKPETREIVSVVVFEDAEAVEAWRDHPARQEVLERLQPLRSKAYSERQFQLLGRYEAAS